jgi:FKBP-type peptidyl-prolyl cis-trans isomerase
MKRISLIIIVCIFALTACKKDNNIKYKTADNGLEYCIYKSTPENQKAKIGDVVVLDLIYKSNEGTILFNSKDMNRTYMMTVKEPTHPGGSFEDALAMMHVGDSASFKINAHDFYKFSLRQKSAAQDVNKNEKITIYVRVKEILEKKDFDNHIIEGNHVNEEKEQELLKAYLERANITIEPTESGLYYIPIRKGQGEKAEIGKKITVHYTGTLISGKVFDSSLGKKPFSFILGQKQVIEGWEEGIALMRKGEKATLIIPSKLGYKDKGSRSGSILPYSSLIFEIEIIDVQ